MEFHWSNLNMLMRCAYQYECYMTLGPRRPGSALIIGSGTHDSIERNLLYKIDTGLLLPEDVVTDAARDGVIGRIDREGLQLTEEEAAIGKAKVVGQMQDQAVALARLHHLEAAPKIQPVAVERKWSLEIGDTGHTLAGRIDIEEARGIRDTKTTGKSPTQAMADTADQLTTYGMAKQVLDGIAIEDQTLTFDYLHKLVTPLYKPIETRRTQADVQALLMRVTTAFRVIESGVFMPTSRDNWWCSKKWCGYHDVCPYAGGKD